MIVLVIIISLFINIVSVILSSFTIVMHIMIIIIPTHTIMIAWKVMEIFEALVATKI